MKGARYKKRGWFGESYRHYLAAKRIKTSKTKCKPKLKHGIDLDSQFNSKELKMGVKVEKEHTDDATIAKQIAKAHLAEFPDYYTRLQRMEDEAKAKVAKVAIKVEKPTDGSIYPVSPDEVKKIIDNQDPAHIKGLKAIEFSNPKGEQKGAWAQYIRSRNTIKVFSQPQHSKCDIDGLPPENVNTHMKEYVIPHEIGHHRALFVNKITDRELPVAEARADAHVIGLDPKDGAIHALVR